MARVKVSIKVEERVKYHRYVEMEKDEYNRISSQLSGSIPKLADRAAEEIRCMIDPRADFQDADDLDITTFEIARPK